LAGEFETNGMVDPLRFAQNLDVGWKNNIPHSER